GREAARGTPGRARPRGATRGGGSARPRPTAARPAGGSPGAPPPRPRRPGSARRSRRARSSGGPRRPGSGGPTPTGAGPRAPHSPDIRRARRSIGRRGGAMRRVGFLLGLLFLAGSAGGPADRRPRILLANDDGISAPG